MPRPLSQPHTRTPGSAVARCQALLPRSRSLTRTWLTLPSSSPARAAGVYSIPSRHAAAISEAVQVARFNRLRPGRLSNSAVSLNQRSRPKDRLVPIHHLRADGQGRVSPFLPPDEEAGRLEGIGGRGMDGSQDDSPYQIRG